MASGTARLGLRAYLTAQRLGNATLAAGIILSCLALFFIDINLPRGVLDSAGYSAVVALTSRYGKRTLLASAAMTTVFTLLAGALSLDEGITVAGMWANRAFTIITIWVVALIVRSRIDLANQIQNRKDDLRRYEAALARMVRHCLLQDVSFSQQLRFVCQTSAEALRCEAGLIQMRNPDGNSVTVLESWDKPPRGITRQPGTVLKEDRFHKPRLLKEFVVATDDVELAEVEPATRKAIRQHGVRATLAAEIFHGAPQSATIWLGKGEKHHWSHEEIAFARSVAGLVALLFSTRRNAETLAALELIDEGIYTEDAAGRVQYSNRAANLLAHGLDGSSTIPRAEAPLTANQDQHEIRFEDRDLEIHRTRLPAGGLIARLIDVTERNIAEAERVRLENRLQQAAKTEAIGQLASGVAHDFNNILGAITGFAGFIAQDAATDSQNRGFAQRILTAAKRGEEMVDQIMAFAETRTPPHRPVDLGRVIEASRELLAPSMYPGAVLEVEPPTAALLVCGDQVQIGQMISNLITNGRDALDGGGGVVEVEAANAPEEDVESFRNFSNTPFERLVGEPVPGQRYARVIVRDSGGGIVPDVMDRIFEPFFSTKDRRRGTGLGLAVVHGVIHSHGGFCHVQSAVGKGTAFQVYLPIAEADMASVSALPNCGALGRVLIVDDDTDVADMLSIGLERLGYATVAVQHPQTALEALEEDPSAFDTLLTDLRMPQMSGAELIRKARQVAPHLRIVLCTGEGAGITEAEARALGADVMLRKPVEIQRIAKAVSPQPGGDLP
ncbi:MAG TPA: response regulator [Rhizomicrobium sp.]|nr:response regulator [Rhizomicrobium sp.]